MSDKIQNYHSDSDKKLPLILSGIREITEHLEIQLNSTEKH
jgi:hypothetical protein